MSETVLVKLIDSLPIVLTVVMAAWFKSRQDAREYQRSLSADNTANAKLDHITVLTNSTLTAANKEIGDLKKQVQELLEVIKNEQADSKGNRIDPS